MNQRALIGDDLARRAGPSPVGSGQLPVCRLVLLLPELSEQPAMVEELCNGSILNDASVREEEDPVGSGDGGEPVCDNDLGLC
jgi:hypothetical protein